MTSEFIYGSVSRVVLLKIAKFNLFAFAGNSQNTCRINTGQRYDTRLLERVHRTF